MHKVLLPCAFCLSVLLCDNCYLCHQNALIKKLNSYATVRRSFNLIIISYYFRLVIYPNIVKHLVHYLSQFDVALFF